jgi:BMFP domain-containing protein YqiC
MRIRAPYACPMARKNPGSDAADTLRSAVDRTVQATMDQASQVRGVLPATRDDLEILRAQIVKLEKRVAALERKQKAPARAGAKKKTSS